MKMSAKYTNFGLKPFWFWNGNMDDDCIVKQIDEMKEKGLGGFFIHPRQGLKIPYMSKKWFDKVGVAIERAKKTGLEVWLYDEYPYPSGIGGGEVIAGHPEYEAYTLQPKIADVEGPGELEIDLEWGTILNAVACPIINGTLIWDKQIDIKEYIGIIHKNKVFQHGGSSIYNDKRYFTAGLAKKLIWPIPYGKWRVFVFVESHVKNFKYFGTFIDSLNKDAIARFIQLTHEQYKKHFGYEFGKTIKGIFTDETSPFGRDLPWSPLLPKLFTEQNGYSLNKNLPALFDNIGPNTNSVRYDYWNTTVNAFIESFDKQIHGWCQKNNLLYSGEKNILRSSQIQYMDIPGVDAGHHKTGSEAGIADPRYRANAKLLSSGCHFYEKEKALCECFHSVGWSMTIQDMKWMLDWLIYQGINMFVPHGFFYTTDGLKKYDAPPSQFYQMPWWKHMGKLSDYVVNLLDILSYGKRKVNILVLDPVTSTWTSMGEKLPLLERLREDFSKLQKTLLFEQLDYYIVDPQLLAQSQIENRGINIKGEVFSVLVIPPTLNIEQEAWAVIKHYMENGGVTIFTGCLPIERIDEFKGAKEYLNSFFEIDSEQFYLNYIENKENVIYEKAYKKYNSYFVPVIDNVPDIVGRTSNNIKVLSDGEINKKILVAHYSKNSENIYFLINTSDESFTANVFMPDIKSNSISQISLETGSIGKTINVSKNDGKAYVFLSFKQFESYLLVEDNNVLQYSEDKSQKVVIETNEEWNIKLKKQNALRLGKWTLDISIPRNQGTAITSSSKRDVYCQPLINQIVEGEVNLPIQLKKSGFGCESEIVLPQIKAVYTSRFYMDVSYKVWLVIEPDSIEGQWYVVLNDEIIPPEKFMKKEFYSQTNLGVDVSSLLHIGENTIKVCAENQNQTGGLLNPLYLFGDFGVYKDEKGMWHINTLKEKGTINQKVKCGFPFYAGEVIYSRNIEITNPNDKPVYEFSIEDKLFQDSVMLTINGHNAGAICWNPYKWYIDGEHIKSGKNYIELQTATALLGLFEGQLKKPNENQFVEL